MGKYKIITDWENMLIKFVWVGKFEAWEIEEGIKLQMTEVKKYSKGEPLLLIDSSNIDMGFIPPDAAKALQKCTLFHNSYCKKIATVVPNFMFQEPAEVALGYILSERSGFFSSEQEAIQWLLRD